jgi:hypothetical protein
MDSSKLFGTFRGSTALTFYRPAGNNIYNVDNRISSFYNTTTTQPNTEHNYLYYNTTGVAWRFRPYQLNGGSGVRSPSIYWGDLSASNSVFDLTNAHYLTYNGVSGRFVPYQKQVMTVRQFPGSTFDSAKLSTQQILVMNDSTIANDNAFNIVVGSQLGIGASTTNLMLPYMSMNNSGLTLQNACYNRNIFINTNVYISFTSIGNGATFTLYIYLADVIIGESTMSCKNGQNSLAIFANTVLKTTVADVGKKIFFKIKYTAGDATPLTIVPFSQFYASVRTL